MRAAKPKVVASISRFRRRISMRLVAWQRTSRRRDRDDNRLYGAALLAVLILASLESTAVADTPPAPVTLTIKLDKEKFEVGEPIELTIVLKNLGQQVFKVDRSSDVTGMIDGYTFQVSDERGKLIQSGGPAGSDINAIGGTDKLMPGNAHERVIFLNYHMPVLQPGTYSVRCGYQALRSKTDMKISPASVKFQIVKTAPIDLERRIANLEAELKNPNSASKSCASSPVHRTATGVRCAVGHALCKGGLVRIACRGSIALFQ